MKSILIIDTPKNCLDCQLMVDGWCYGVKADRTQDTISAKDRTCWCPLKDLPSKMIPEMVMGNKFAEGCVQGWNDCIDTITGETE